MGESLSELLERCRAGDADAMGLLLRRFQPWALDLARAILRDGHRAEDAVQNAFVRALLRLGELRQPRAFPAWLRQIIRTEAQRMLRQRSDTSLDRQTDLAALADGPLEQAQMRERRQLVLQAVASLPKAGRETAELFYLEEYDCARIAERLHVPEGTVKRRLHDARARLRDLLLGQIDDSDRVESHTSTDPGPRP